MSSAQLRRGVAWAACLVLAISLAAACAPSAGPTPPPAPPDPAVPSRPLYSIYYEAALHEIALLLAGYARTAPGRPAAQTVSAVPPTAFYRTDSQRYDYSLFHLTEEEAALDFDRETLSGEPLMTPRPAALFAPFPAACVTFWTRDESIRTVNDLAGKRVFLGAPGTAWRAKGELALRAAGVWEHVDVAPGVDEGLQWLFEGEVDATVGGLLLQRITTPEAALLAVTLQSLPDETNLYGVSIPEEVVREAALLRPEWAEAGLVEAVALPADAARRYVRADYDLFREGANCLSGGSVVYATSPNTDDAFVYEVMRSLIEGREALIEALPLGHWAQAERIGHAWLRQAAYHPAARRAYEEAGLTYGVEGIREWEAAQ